MGNNQIVNKTNKHSKKREKKKRKEIPGSGTVEFQSSLFWCYSFSILSCLSASPRQVWRWRLVVFDPSCGGRLPVCWWASRWVVAQWACRVEAWGLQGGGLAVLQGRGLAGWPVAVAWLACGLELPTCSFSVLWHGEAFHRLGVQLCVVFYLIQLCLQHLSKVPDSWNSCSLHLCPTHHFGSLPTYF
jgi:hypothetical protein